MVNGMFKWEYYLSHGGSVGRGHKIAKNYSFMLCIIFAYFVKSNSGIIHLFSAKPSANKPASEKYRQ